MVHCGICIGGDSHGLYLAIRIKRWQKIIYLKRRVLPAPVKAPEESDPTVITEKPIGKVFDIEDIDREPEKVKLIEPEDM